MDKTPAPTTQNPPKAALITGASQRIGAALARTLAQMGWSVALHYNQSAQQAERLAAEIAEINQRTPAPRQVAAYPLQADLADAAAAARLIARAREKLGPLHALINNASLFEHDTAENFTIESWNAHLNINLRAPALLMRDFANQPHWEQGQGVDKQDGCIINITDQRVKRLTPDFLSYTVAKYALHGLTTSFAQSLAAKHIRVNAIAPGPTLPNPRQNQAAFDKQAGLVPLRHGASPDDIARAARYLLTAPSVTAQTLTVDGGQHIAWQTPDVTQVKE